MENFKGVIYLTTNIINGKKYIGKDSNNRPNYLGSGKLLIRAIKKYGKDNFKKEILAEANNQKDLCDLERYYIAYYNATSSDLFYNIASGGLGGVTAYKELLSVNQYDESGKFIRFWKNYKDAAKFFKVLPNRIITSYYQKRIVKGFLFRKPEDGPPIVIPKSISTNFKKVKQYSLINNELINEFESVTEACNILGISHNHIYRSIKGELKKPDFKWEIVGYKEKPRIKNEKIIYQIDRNLKVIYSYKNIKDIPKIFRKSCIYLCLKGKRRSSQGFYWSYTKTPETSKKPYGFYTSFKNRKDRVITDKNIISVYDGENIIFEGDIHKLSSYYKIDEIEMKRIVYGSQKFNDNLKFKVI